MSLRIGTRKSPLALWQARQVEDFLVANHQTCSIVPVDSQGDLNLKQPLYTMGISGIFTKNLDIALLNNQVDMAVHSLKDVPTRLPQGIDLVCYMKRGTPADVLIHKDNFNKKDKRTLATGSLRRQAFWKHKFPRDKVVDLRGNLATRLAKLADDQVDGIIMAAAGIERSEMQQEIEKLGYTISALDWMIPAPAQGIVAVAACRPMQVLQDLNHPASQMAAQIERRFLEILEGGCTAPIGAHAQFVDNRIEFRAAVLQVDGSQKLDYHQQFNTQDWESVAEIAADELFQKGAKELVEQNRAMIQAMKK